MSRWAVFIILGLLSGVCSAQNFFCANTYRYVQVGQTTAQVAAACGKPTASRELRENKSVEAPSVAWFYYIQGPQNILGASPIAEPRGTNRVQLVFHFRDQTVERITLGGEEVRRVTVCGGGRPVSIGDKQALVSGACGDPSLVNLGTDVVSKRNIPVTEWVYDFGQYKPKLILRFENDKLVSGRTQ
jgi:Protein of unknown function (DUF2845)